MCIRDRYTTTPWYVSQPWRVALDLDDSDERIAETTRTLIAETARAWAPVETWKRELAGRLSAQAASSEGGIPNPRTPTEQGRGPMSGEDR